MLWKTLSQKAAGLVRSAPPAWATPASDEAVRLFAYDLREPLEIQIESTEEREGAVVHSLSYASPKGGRVTAFLVVPQGFEERPGSLAGMLLLHGMPGNRRDLLARALVLARAGAVCLLIDAPFARSGQGPVTLSERDRDWQIQLIVDLQRGVDLLLARPDVDPRRLGFLGVSYGAALGGLLAGVERRIATYVLAVGDGGLVTHFGGGRSVRRLPAPRRRRWLEALQPIEPLRFIGRAAPASLFFQSARRDSFVPRSDARHFQEAGSAPKRVQWYDAGHELNDQARRDQMEWLRQEIGLGEGSAAS